MTLKEALIALAEGKKVRDTSWGPEHYVQIQGNIIVDEDGDRSSVTIVDDDWELYEEPKKKKVVYEWLIEDRELQPEPWISSDLLTEAGAKESWPNAKLTPLRSFEVEE